MAFDLSKINYRTVADPADFIAECDAEYAARIAAAADQISANRRLSPIVLLSGPSGSGKTTTAQKIEEELRRRGIKSYTISLDNYFRTVDPQTTPRTADGGYDFESPGFLSIFAPGKSILFTATIIGISAAFAWLIASTV